MAAILIIDEAFGSTEVADRQLTSETGPGSISKRGKRLYHKADLPAWTKDVSVTMRMEPFVSRVKEAVQAGRKSTAISSAVTENLQDFAQSDSVEAERLTHR